MKEKDAYTYKKMQADFSRLEREFPFIKTGEIGKSIWGRPIKYLKIGNGKRKILFVSAHHGMEHLTSKLVLTFARRYLFAFKEGGQIGGKSADELYDNSSLYIVPMLNPDGVDLSVFGLSASDITNEEYLRKINPSGDFSFWQANANGVDLNHNYNALFKKSKKSEKDNNIEGPGPTRFSGRFPESEPESFALASFTRKENFDMVMAFHSQGKVIYYDFNGKEPKESLKIAKMFEEISEYKIEKPEKAASFGGFKDWFIDYFKRSGFTIEIGEGKNPLPLSDLEKVYSETLGIMISVLL